MKLQNFLTGSIVASAGLLLYGAFVDAYRLDRVKRNLRLPRWPEHLDGYRIGLLADLHLRDDGTVKMACDAVDFLVDEKPDIVCMVGDYVSNWYPHSEAMLAHVLGPLAELRTIAVPGNRDYYKGDPENLRPVFDKYGIELLRNEMIVLDGIQWIGIDSANKQQADPFAAFQKYDPDQPAITLWHEPDMVEWLPEGPSLMLSGHSHGGQFTTPWGWAPMRSKNGEKYLRGFYPNAPTPLYVSRGLGTTGPPSRLFCLPEVTIISLYSNGGTITTCE